MGRGRSSHYHNRNYIKKRMRRFVWHKHNRTINDFLKEMHIVKNKERYLNLTWKIDILQSDVEMLEEAYGKHITIPKPKTDYEEIQIRAYAHSIIVMKEIICLLKEGFPDGALARARRLYEQMVIFYFFEKHKSDDDFDKLIERYCDSQDVKSYYNLIAFYDFYNDDVNKKKAEKNYSDMKRKYSSYLTKKGYFGEYWWIGDSNYQSFEKLQRTYAEPFAKIMYSRACISSHAGAMGDYALLGRLNPDGNKIYTGPTYNGFSLPLLLAVMSYYNTTKVVFHNLEIELPEAHKDLYNLLGYYQKTFYEMR